jgi:hypothetical protein
MYYKKLINEYKFILTKMLNEDVGEEVTQPNLPIEQGAPPPHVFGPLFGDINQWIENIIANNTPSDTVLGGFNWLADKGSQYADQNELNVIFQQYLQSLPKETSSEFNWDALSNYTIPINPNQIYAPGQTEPPPPRLPAGYEWVQTSTNPPQWGIMDNTKNPPRLLQVRELFGFGRNISISQSYGARKYPPNFPLLPRTVSGVQGQEITYGTNLTQQQVQTLLGSYKFKISYGGQNFEIDLTDPSSWPSWFTFSQYLEGISQFFTDKFGRFSYIGRDGVVVNTPGAAPSFSGSRAPVGFAGFVWDPKTGTYTVVSHSSEPGQFDKWLKRILQLMGWNWNDPLAPRPALPPGFWNLPDGKPSGANNPIDYINIFNNNYHEVFGVGINPPGTHNLGPYHIHAYRPPRKPSKYNIPGQMELPFFPGRPGPG